MSLINPDDPDDPVRKLCLPQSDELVVAGGMGETTKDPYGDDKHDKGNGVLHKYEYTALVVATEYCAMYCRHCFRKELVVDKELQLRFDVDEGLAWIAEHMEIREMPHIEMIRIGTRLPIVLPYRITEGLKNAIGGYHEVPVWINTQCNHPKEITPLTQRTVYELMSSGINVGNQAVLLKGINDVVETFRELHQKLLRTRIRPYYLFYCEPAPGIDHFRTPVEKGAELIRDAIRGHTTGLAQPMYVLATNIGKIPLVPDYYIVGKDEREYTLRNYKGEVTRIPAIPE